MSIEFASQANHPSVPAPDIQVVARPAKSQRIPALDFTKGALVLLMVLYHWINYFIGQEVTYYYKYLRFLTPSFIFIAGFMISNVYLSKYAAADPRLSKRLFSRGLKLFAIFLALNLARILAVPFLGTDSQAQNLLDPKNLFTVFVSGNFPVSGSKLVSFSILVPISYLLMLSGALMIPYRRYRYTFHAVCGALLLGILILGMTGARSYDLEFVTMGMLGVLAGFAPIESINRLVQHPYLLVLAYAGYVAAITLWDVYFPLLAVGTALSLMVIYSIGSRASESGKITGEMILLGKYSLLGYISQIGILQTLAAGFHRLNLGFAGLVLSFLAAFAFTIVSVEIVDRARTRMTSVDRMYRWVFA
jgi:peptidoglycan/LPS O-acetylase OafA/YrhL